MPSMLQTFFSSRIARSFIAFWAVAVLLLAPAFDAFAAPTEKEKLPPGSSPIGAGIPAVITGNIPETVGNTLAFISTQLTQSAVIAFLNAAQTFFGTLAYDAASYIASGGQGQDALYYKQSFGKYLQDVAMSTAGDLVGSFSEGMFRNNGVAFDLCAPTNPLQQQRFTLALGSMFSPPQMQSRFNRPTPRCDIRNVVNNWSGLVSTLQRTEVFDAISFSVSSQTSDVGVFNTLVSRYNTQLVQAIDKAREDRKEGGGFKAVSNIISGNVKTPAQLVSSEIKSQLVEMPKQGQLAVTSAIFNNAFEIGLPALFQYTASVFANTLTSKLMKRLFERGLDGGLTTDLALPATADAIVGVNRADTRRAFVDLKTPVLQQVRDLEIVAEMMGCPTEGRGTWNCTMDQALGRALQTQSERGGFTVRDAIDEKLLHGDWKLIPDSKTKENTDRDCYQNSYCAGNLRKMRLMRILPVGFEFAANSPKNIAQCETAQGCATLQEVVDGFFSCNAQGQADALNPWCKMIDPNWVLTSIPQRCTLSGFTDQLVTEQYTPRRQECQDVQTCLTRNDKGECIGGYGYCLAEKTAYRFGADECSAKDASCRVYTTRNGEQVSYLRNTVDYGTCSEDSVGCRWYSTRRDPTGGQTDAWVGTPTTVTDKAYFNAKLQSCDSTNEGCTQLRVVRQGESSLNLIQNPSFERLSDATSPAGKIVSAWKNSSVAERYSTPKVDEGQAAFDGAQSLQLTGSFLDQRIDITPGRQYVFSYYIRRPSAVSPVPTLNVSLVESITPADQTASAVSPTELQQNFLSTESCRLVGSLIDVPAPGALNALDVYWQRAECSFVAAQSARSVAVTLRGTNLLIDGIQLEEGTGATAFVDGINQTLQPIHMKVASDEFACTGDATTDHPSCAKFAKVCRQSEAGCQGYRDAEGGNEIPAIVSQQDLCPQQCVGYAEFRKLPSSFDLVADADARVSDAADTVPSYFIPSTASLCSQSQVGCEAFTNLEKQGQGGESQAYFSYVRACEKPSADSQTYYTWEGSDTTGYQLRTWSLVKSTRTTPGEASPEVLALPAGTDPFSIAAGPRILLKRAPGQSTFKEPASCNERSWRGDAGVAIDPDCRQFYDANGAIFYRFYSQTVLATDSCTRYRISKSTQIDCQKTGGTFDTTSGECVYNVFEPESLTCSAQAASCRAFAGAQSGSVQNVVTQNFRNGTVAPFVAPQGTLSTEALLVGDSSLRLDNSAAAGINSLTAATTFASTPSSLYRVTFYGKSPNGQRNVRVLVNDGTVGSTAATVTAGQVTLGPDWQRYTVGLFSGAAGTAKLTKVTLAVDAPSATVVFLDEIVIAKIPDVVYARLDSWKTPATCDRSFAGAEQPQAMLGCRAYTNRAGQTVNARQFTQLCRESAISCTAFVDTRNSADTGAQTFVRGDDTAVTNVVTNANYGTATTTRAADRFLYLIDDPAKRCNSTEASCRAFGRPVMSADRTKVDSWETVYVKDDVTKYDAALCRPSQEFCDAFGTPKGGKEYFRDPDTHICEYKTDVKVSLSTIAPGRYDGYFIRGTDTPCYPDNLQDGRSFAMKRRGDVGYAGWTGLCSPEMGECTEFRDPNDTTDSRYTSGRPYFFIQNEKIDTTSCTSGVDQSRGCILLQDTTRGEVLFSTKASYQEYQKQAYRPTTPVNCADSSAPECQPIGGGAAFTNDANMLVKVKIDRDCAQWLGCSTAETVLDPSTNRYKDVCSTLSMCDRGTGSSNDIFCGNYVDRATAAKEPVLTQGAFFGSDQYTRRQVGLGAKDYSGFAIPNAFQVADLVNTRVAVEGLPNNRDVAAKYPLEYRLASRVKLSTTLAAAGPDGAVPALAAGPRFEQIQSTFPTLKLCVHTSTARFGFDGGDNFCYLPVSAQGNPQDYNFYNLAGIYTSANSDPEASSLLQRAFPPAECRANPEQDSPFSAKYVTAWDFSVDPPKPITKVAGLANANTCEYGEDCSCTYKRADFGGAITKFVAPYSSNVPTGICQGGPRDGQACVPTDLYGQTVQSESNVQNRASVTSLNCGPLEGGGRCVGLTKSTIVGGIFGQCLERDTTRTVGRDSQSLPCLTWNPTPVLFGDKDRYHYSPSAGYLPPENAGQYYCTDLQRPVKKISLVQDVFERFGQYRFAGGMNKMYFDANCVNQNAPTVDHAPMCDIIFSTVSTTNAYGFGLVPTLYDPVQIGKFVGTPYLTGQSVDGGVSSMIIEGPASSAHDVGGTEDGGHPKATNMCELAYKHQVTSAQPGTDGYDIEALRLVGTGMSSRSSYVETFFKINPRLFAARMSEGLMGRTIVDGKSTSTYLVKEPTPAERFTANQEQNIEYFQIDPIKGVTPAGRLGCGYQEDWVDNVKLSVDDAGYGDKSALKTADETWREQFYSAYNPILNRSTETYYADDGGRGRMIKAPCMWTDGANGDNPDHKADGLSERQSYPAVLVDGSLDPSPSPSDASRLCYFKFWESGYRDKDQPKFQSLYQADGRTPNGQSLDSIRQRPLTQRCTADKPYFSIRAVFQTSAAQNGKAVVGPNDVDGPWRFMGFWTTSCGGKNLENDYRSIYFNVDVKQTDVCSQVAEVRSINSRQDAAFTDRVWKESGYAIPDSNITYGVRFSPFSSALNTKPAGKDPLFQGGGDLSLSGKTRQSGFVGSGVDSYFQDNAFPKDKWAYLTNLFARVYRVYNYYDQPVLATDYACVNGPAKGQKCVKDDAIHTLLQAAATGRTLTDAERAQLTAFYAQGGEPGYAVCSVNGVCDATLANESDLSNNSICNSLSGINAGLSCGAKPAVDWFAQNGLKTSADVCHLGPLRNNGGTWEPVFAKCVAFNDFSDPQYALATATWPTDAAAVAKRDTLGRCENGNETAPDGVSYKKSLRAGQYCLLTAKGADGKGVTSDSYTCPRQVQGLCNVGTGRCELGSISPDVAASYSIEHTMCKHNADCSFTEKNYYVMTQDAADLSWNGDVPLPNSRSYVVTDETNGDKLINVNVFNDADKAAALAVLSGSANACTKKNQPDFTGTNGPFGEELCLGAVKVNKDNFSVRDCAQPHKPDIAYNQALRITSPGAIDPPNKNVDGGMPFGDQDFRAIVNSDPNRLFYTADSRFPNRSPDVWEYLRAPSTGIHAPSTFLGSLANFLNTARWGPFCIGFAGGGQQFLANQAKCEPLKDLYSGKYNQSFGKFGRCRGGIYNNRLCLNPAPSTAYSCNAPIGADLRTDLPLANYDGYDSCLPVTSAQCGGQPGQDPDTDANSCTHGAGYYPRSWFCPDEKDEYCGLITYQRTQPESYNPLSLNPLPTDVTLGHYTPWFFGARQLPLGFYSYVGYYTPRPPRLAAPDSSSCPTPGQCKIQKMDAFSLDGLSEGVQSIQANQHKAVMRFYAWAAHNQMAMRKLVVDWGDTQKQTLNDAKMKNKKPFCGVQKECWTADQGHTGLTCQSNADCPAGGGTCEPLGFCEAEPHKMCATDSECDRVVGANNVAGRCMARAYFGNSPEACETNYFEFAHLYACTGPASVNNVQCGVQNRCSRDPSRTCTTANDCGAGDQCLPSLAPPGGCWDAAVGSCRFTPRVTIEDNWGWCTGECRGRSTAGGAPEDLSTSGVIHRYGGCYSGTILGDQSSQVKVRSNLNVSAVVVQPITPPVLPASECNDDALPVSGASADTRRPWVVFPGSLQLRGE